MVRESTVACLHCGFAGITGSGCFDYYRFPLGGVRYWAISFFVCMECGITHCQGGHGAFGARERSDLFAQPRPLLLVKLPVTVLRGDEGFQELRDAIQVDEWLPCNAKADRTRQGPEPEDGTRYTGQYSCSACKRPGSLAWSFGYDSERLWRCPLCRQQALGYSSASALYKGLAVSMGD
jgi:hypothetical protein